MPRPRLPLSLATSVAVLSLALCSCGTGGDAVDLTAAAPGGRAAPMLIQQSINAQPRDRLRQGGTLNWGIEYYPSQWNPLHNDGTLNATDDVMKALLPTFWRSDAAGIPTPNPVFLKDVRTETRQGKQVVTWTINPQAHWSDGDPITWRDIEANWKAMSGADTAFKVASTTGFEQVESVTRGEDDRQAVMTFRTPYSEWQSMFNNAANGPLLPAKYVSTAEQFNTAYKDAFPVSAGPFRVERLDPAARAITVVADPGWWGDRAMLDRIVFKAVDNGSMADVFARGDLDFFNNGPSLAGYQKILATQGAEIRKAGGPNVRILVLNGKNPALDQKVRQALFQAIDREAVTRNDLNGLDWPYTPDGNHFLVPGQNGYRDNSGGLSRYDPQAAERQLDAVGWKRDGTGTRVKDGRELALRFVIPSPNQLAAGEGSLIAQQLAKIGVRVDVVPVPAGEFFDKYVYRHDFDLTAVSTFGTPFPVGSSASNFRTGAGSNLSQTGSDALDGLLTDAGNATSVDAVYSALNRADAEAWQVAGTVPLYQRPAIYGVRKNVANLGAPGLSDFVYENIGFLR